MAGEVSVARVKATVYGGDNYGTVFEATDEWDTGFVPRINEHLAFDDHTKAAVTGVSWPMGPGPVCVYAILTGADAQTMELLESLEWTITYRRPDGEQG